MHAIILIACLYAAPAEKPDLTGNVVDGTGKPVAGASVMIYTAGARVGVNPYCPSCYADCAKSAKTDKEGRFLIRSLDPSLIFRVLVVGEGFEPEFVSKVDPFKGPIKAQIKPRDPKRLEPFHFVRGRVVGDSGQALVGAEVSAHMFRTKSYWGFTPGVFDPVAITNQNGDFTLTANSSIENVDLKVEARGYAGKIVGNRVPTASGLIQLGRGVSITGRVLRQGKPVVGAGVGVAAVDRSMGSSNNNYHYFNHWEIATDDTGRFLFSNVSALDRIYVYGLMSSIKSSGAINVREVTTGGDGTTMDVGDLKIGEGHRISGRIVLSDQKPVPPHTRVLVSREQAWDSQIIELDEHGRFEAIGVPDEVVTISSRIKGYRLSTSNANASPLNPGVLEGRVDRDLPDLVILYEPGAVDRSKVRFDQPEFRDKYAKFQATRARGLAGIVAEKPH